MTTTDPTGARVLQDYVASQVEVLEQWRQRVIDDAPDAVHKSRVATRRLRSLLRTFRPLLGAERTEPLRAELAWWAGVLGAPRDAEVMLARLVAAVEELPDLERRGPVVARLTIELTEEHRRAHADLVAQIDGDRARALRAELARVAASLPVLTAAGQPARDVLPPLVGACCDRVDAAAAKAHTSHGDAALFWWHETRKKAKAARYAGESMADAFGVDAKALGKAYEAVTESLGELQDSVVACERLVELAQRADDARESTVTYWTLVERQRAAGHAAVRAGIDALAAVEEAAVRDWTR